MNKNVEQASVLVQQLLPGLQQVPEVERVICPPFTSLMILSAQLTGTGVGIGAQNMHWADSGAYTGEVSPQMVREFCDYVIIGHSERRAYFGETDETVNKKVISALALGLIPIVCIGETLAEYESGVTGEVINKQVLEGLKEIEPTLVSMIVIAYEPVWAIGTGRTATSEQAQEVHAAIRAQVAAADEGVAAGLQILYGGSCKPSNAAELFAMPDIDGGLIGGASLVAADFLAICRAAVR